MHIGHIVHIVHMLYKLHIFLVFSLPGLNLEMSNAALNACCWDAAIRVSGRYYSAWRRYSDFFIGYI